MEPLKADAGDNITVSGGELVTLDGSNSNAGLNSIVSHQWFITSQPATAVAQQLDSTEQVLFTLSTEGVYEIQYTITDENNKSSSDTVLITVDSGFTLSQCNVDTIVSDEMRSNLLNQLNTFHVAVNMMNP